jgi:hypothetical protein
MSKQRKACYPTSSWGVVDMELWLLCVATPKFSTVQRPFNTGLVNQHSQQLAVNNSLYNGIPPFIASSSFKLGSFTRSFANFRNKFKSMNSHFQIVSFILTGMRDEMGSKTLELSDGDWPTCRRPSNELTIWKWEFIDLNLFLKFAKDLVNEPSLKDELAIKGGIFTVVNQKKHYINNIHDGDWPTCRRPSNELTKFPIPS